LKEAKKAGLDTVLKGIKESSKSQEKAYLVLTYHPFFLCALTLFSFPPSSATTRVIYINTSHGKE
jgi:hypothetical protein